MFALGICFPVVMVSGFFFANQSFAVHAHGAVHFPVVMRDASFSHLPFKRLIDDKWTKFSVEERDKRSRN